MKPSCRWAAIVLPLVLVAARPVAAQQAAPPDRCTGTLCDFYYGGPPSATQAAAASTATPVTVPAPSLLGRLFSGGSAPAAAAPAASGTDTPAATPSRVQIQGGGLLGMATGAPAPAHCGGTLCDFMYGSSAAEIDNSREPLNGQAIAGPSLDDPPRQAPPQDSAAPAPQTVAVSADPTPDSDPDIAPAPRRGVEYVEPREKPLCAGTAADPWRCYR